MEFRSDFADDLSFFPLFMAMCVISAVRAIVNIIQFVLSGGLETMRIMEISTSTMATHSLYFHHNCVLFTNEFGLFWELLRDLK